MAACASTLAASAADETTLKRWLQGGRRQPWLARMYRQSLEGLRRLLRRSDPTGLLFLARANLGQIGEWPRSHRLRSANSFDHLTCFVPGMLALGAHAHAGINATWEWEVAHELLHTCSVLYSRQETGLGPESVVFVTHASVEAAQAERRRALSGQRDGDEEHAPRDQHSDSDSGAYPSRTTVDVDSKGAARRTAASMSTARLGRRAAASHEAFVPHVEDFEVIDSKWALRPECATTPITRDCRAAASLVAMGAW